MKRALMTGLICCLASLICGVKSGGEESGRFIAEVKRFLAVQIPEAFLLKTPPESSPDGDKHIPGARAAIMKKYPDTDPKNLIRIIWPKESWTILRNEFTGIIYARYCFAYVLTPSDKEDEYWAAQVNFMQKARLMGLYYDDTYVDSLLRVERLKKKANRVPEKSGKSRNESP